MIRNIFLLLLMLLASHVSAKTRLIVTFESKENPPYYMGEGPQMSATYPGISVDVINEIANKLDIDVIYRRAPWQRGMFMISNNHVDAIFHASFNEERQQVAHYPMKNGALDESRSIMPQSYYFYEKKANKIAWDGKNYDSIEGKVGAVIGYSVTDFLRDRGVDIIEIRNQLIGLRMLQFGRISAFAGIETMVDYQIQLHVPEFSDIEKHHPPVMTKNYYLLFSKRFYRDNTALAERIWDEIKVIRESGRYEEITAKYRNALN